MASPKHSGANPLNLSSEAVAGGGAAAVASKITWPVQDAMHLIHTAESVRTGASAHHAFTGLSSLGHSIGGLLGVAAGTGVSAYLNHLVHGHHEKTMVDRYRPQLGAILGKDESQVNVDDLYHVAYNNPSLDEELDRNRGMRNLRTGATLVATTLAFVAVFAAVSLFPPLAALGAAAAAGGIFSGAGLGFIASSMAISLGVLHLSGKGITKLGKKLFGYDKPNVEDHVNGLDDLVRDGATVAPEQVMGVYVAASPEMQSQIEYAFGGRYDTLDRSQQIKAEAMFGNNLPLEQLSDAINSKQMSPRELIFTVHGQRTGLVPPLTQSAASTADVPQQQVAQAPAMVAPQPAPKRTTASQWRDMVEQQRNAQETGVPQR
jgi:hypothetical protein